MSFWKRVLHYADPRTAFHASVHATQRLAHYADPRTQYHQLVEAAHFTARQARKDYVLGSKITAKAAKIVTPLLAFVASFIPALGLLLGPVLAALGALIERLTASVSLRARGVTGLENRQRSRNEEKRVFEWGMIGSAIGGILSAITGVAFGAATGGEAAGSAVGEKAAATAASQAVPSAAQQISGLAPVATVDTAFASAPAVSPMVGASGAPSAAAQAAKAVTAGAVSAAAEFPAAAAATGILGTGITAKELASFATSLVPKVLSALGPQQQPGGPGGGGSAILPNGGAGTEGTGDTGAGDGPLGALGANLSRLPLPVKLLGFVLGAGVTVYAFNKGRKAA